MAATRTRWRLGVLESDPRSRAELSRLIESGGASVVLDAPPRAESAALVRRLAPDAVILAAEHAVRDGDPLGGILSPDLPAPVVLVSGRATALGWAPIAGVMRVLRHLVWVVKLATDPLTDSAAYSPRTSGAPSGRERARVTEPSPGGHQPATGLG